jgi:hypothetical protein
MIEVEGEEERHFRCSAVKESFGNSILVYSRTFRKLRRHSLGLSALAAQLDLSNIATDTLFDSGQQVGYPHAPFVWGTRAHDPLEVSASMTSK